MMVVEKESLLFFFGLQFLIGWLFFSGRFILYKYIRILLISFNELLKKDRNKEGDIVVDMGGVIWKKLDVVIKIYFVYLWNF